LELWATGRAPSLKPAARPLIRFGSRHRPEGLDRMEIRHDVKVFADVLQ
jgi:hypothetical protein